MITLAWGIRMRLAAAGFAGERGGNGRLINERKF